jgi:small subunit ribosomal protein S9
MPTLKHPTVKAAHKPAKPAVASKSGEKFRYVEAIGRRKTAVVRVRMYDLKHAPIPHGVIVNETKLSEYFPLRRQHQAAVAPFTVLSMKETDYAVTALASGGGTNAQAEALCLGIARALVAAEPTNRPKLKAYGYLKRDPRMVERKKYGSRKARRPQQWRKR